MLYRIAAKESVGYYATWTLGAALPADELDITGWTFKATFERQAGTPDFTLNMAGSPTAQGFRIVDGPGRRITARILAATLAGIVDTTGRFDLTADLLATPPGGERFSVCDLILTVIKGPTA